MADENVESRYKLLVVPEFKSTIPQPLLGKLTDQEKYLVETLSKMEQQNAWLIAAAVESSRASMEVDHRLSMQDQRILRLERWQTILTSKWAVIVAITLVVGPVLLKMVLDLFLSSKP